MHQLNHLIAVDLGFIEQRLMNFFHVLLVLLLDLLHGFHQLRSLAYFFNTQQLFDLLIVKAPEGLFVDFVLFDLLESVFQIVLSEQLLNVVGWRIFLLGILSFLFGFLALLNLPVGNKLDLHQGHVFEVFAHLKVSLQL